MVKFVDVNPADVDTARTGRRGRVSYPIIKAFMERNVKLSKLDLTGLNKRPEYLRSVLTAYVKNHNMPIRIFSANGDLHLMRLDLDNNNQPIPWTPPNVEESFTEQGGGFLAHEEPKPISSDEVKERFKKEKGQITK